MRHRSRLAAAALALTAVTLLSGCGFSSTTLSVLETDRVAEDELPTLESYAYESVDTESSRFVGEYEDVSLWVAKGTDSPACLVAVTEDGDGDPDWIIGCGLPARMSGIGHTFEIRADGSPAPDGMTRISENVYAQ